MADDAQLQRLRREAPGDAAALLWLEPLAPGARAYHRSALRRLRAAMDADAAGAAGFSIARLALTAPDTVARWMARRLPTPALRRDAAGAMLALLKHGFPGMPAPLRARFQAPWRAAYAGFRAEASVDQPKEFDAEGKAAALRGACT